MKGVRYMYEDGKKSLSDLAKLKMYLVGKITI